MRLSNSDLELSRTQPQSSELYLSIFQPSVAMACLVSGTVSNGERIIPYTSVSSGSYLAVESGMTLLVGTSAGGRELGKIRVKSITATHITVAENSYSWSLATHLTVLRYWEVWPIFPRVIPNPAVETDVIFYKDYDDAYTNQNSILGTFICAGSHRAGFVGDTFYYSSTGTHNLVGSNLTYDWAFEGGSVTGSTSATPGNVTYNTAGHYVTRLRVTAANGAVDTTYRYVSIYTRIPSTTKTPIQKWNFDTVSGSRGEGGYTSSIKILDEVIPQVYDGDVVTLWSEDYYGGTKTSIGGNSVGNSQIFFVGHVQNGSVQYDYKKSELTFQLGSISDTMKTAEGFAISVGSHANPSKWFELLDMDARRAIYHYLRWHSTVLYLADFQFMGTDRKMQYFDSDRESLFDAVDNYMRMALVGDLCTDRQGKLWAEVGAYVTSNPTGSFSPIQEITKRDWIGSPSIQKRLIPQLSFVELGGVAYSGSTTGTFSALLSQAPGEVPNTRGSVENIPGLTVAGQDDLNEMSGNLFANRNSKYPVIDMEMAGNFRQFDISPQETVDMNIASTDTNLGEAIHAPYLVDSVSWSYTSKSKILRPSIGFISLVNGTAGTTITIPDIPDGGGYSDFGGGFNFNPGALPPFLSTLSYPTYTWVLNIPTVGGYPGPYINSPRTAIAINAYCVGGTSVSFNIESRNTIGSPGTDLVSSDVVAPTTGVASGATSPALAAGSWLWVDVSNVTGIISKLVITLSVV